MVVQRHEDYRGDAGLRESLHVVLLKVERARMQKPLLVEFRQVENRLVERIVAFLCQKAGDPGRVEVRARMRVHYLDRVLVLVDSAHRFRQRSENVQREFRVLSREHYWVFYIPLLEDREFLYVVPGRDSRHAGIPQRAYVDVDFHVVEDCRNRLHAFLVSLHGALHRCRHLPDVERVCCQLRAVLCHRDCLFRFQSRLHKDERRA